MPCMCFPKVTYDKSVNTMPLNNNMQKYKEWISLHSASPGRMEVLSLHAEGEVLTPTASHLAWALKDWGILQVKGYRSSGRKKLLQSGPLLPARAEALPHIQKEQCMQPTICVQQTQNYNSAFFHFNHLPPPNSGKRTWFLPFFTDTITL